MAKLISLNAFIILSTCAPTPEKYSYIQDFHRASNHTQIGNKTELINSPMNFGNNFLKAVNKPPKSGIFYDYSMQSTTLSTLIGQKLDKSNNQSANSSINRSVIRSFAVDKIQAIETKRATTPTINRIDATNVSSIFNSRSAAEKSISSMRNSLNSARQSQMGPLEAVRANQRYSLCETRILPTVDETLRKFKPASNNYQSSIRLTEYINSSIPKRANTSLQERHRQNQISTNNVSADASMFANLESRSTSSSLILDSIYGNSEKSLSNANNLESRCNSLRRKNVTFQDESDSKNELGNSSNSSSSSFLGELSNHKFDAAVPLITLLPGNNRSNSKDSDKSINGNNIGENSIRAAHNNAMAHTLLEASCAHLSSIRSNMYFDSSTTCASKSFANSLSNICFKDYNQDVRRSVDLYSDTPVTEATRKYDAKLLDEYIKKSQTLYRELQNKKDKMQDKDSKYYFLNALEIEIKSVIERLSIISEIINYSKVNFPKDEGKQDQGAMDKCDCSECEGMKYRGAMHKFDNLRVQYRKIDKALSDHS